MKRQLTEWEKIFTNKATNKRLISKSSCSSKKRKRKRKETSFKKWAEDLNRHFSKEDIQMTKKHMKRFSTSIISGEIKIKTAKRYYLTPVRMAIVNKSTRNK